MRFRIVLIFLFLILSIRLFFLQVIQYENYRRLSEETRLILMPLRAPRGKILDRKGKVLATSVPGFSVFVERGITKDEINLLSKISGISVEEIKKRVEKGGNPARVLSKVSPEVISGIAERKEMLPHVRIDIEPMRYYPLGPITSHFLGYVAQISEEELSIFQGYRMGDKVGKKGIERFYEEYLKGKDGARYLEVDAKGRIIGDMPEREIPPRPGYTLILSISRDLTEKAYEWMNPYAKGACVALNPNTGEILLYSSKPGYDPHPFETGISPEEWKKLVTDTLSPLWDRVSRGGYPPGSVFKIITALAGLEKGILTPETEFLPCEGSMWVGNRKFLCWSRHGKLDLYGAIVQSCDIYFYQVGLRLGVKEICDFSRKIGLSGKTGIDLPDEGESFIPDIEWFNRRYGRRGWGKGNACNLAIGQGEILLTPLKIACIFSGIVNGGLVPVPHLLLRVVDEEGKTVYEYTPSFHRLPVKKENLEFLVHAMEGVVKEDKGTGILARIEGVRVGGKTGTAQNPHGEDHSLFVGFAPVEHPEIVVVAVLENAGHGGSHAAPLVKKIIEYYLSLDKEE